MHPRNKAQKETIPCIRRDRCGYYPAVPNGMENRFYLQKIESRL